MAGRIPVPGTKRAEPAVRAPVHRRLRPARALQTVDLRLYQAQLSAKYTGFANYEQPMHTDRNHSWLPPSATPPWVHVEAFLYLSDVDAGTAPTHLVSRRDNRPAGRTTAPLFMPKADPDLYAAERPAAGPRGSLLAYRPDVFHCVVELVSPGGARFLLNVSFKVAGQDWVGFHAPQSRANSPDWVAFAETCTPHEPRCSDSPSPGIRSGTTTFSLPPPFVIRTST